MDKQELILIHVTGEDKPGLTAALTELLAQYGVDILDIGQVVIHNFLTLGILIRIPDTEDSGAMVKNVLFKAHALGVSLRMHPLSTEKYADWVEAQGKKRFIVTLLARQIGAAHIAKVAAVLSENKLNIDTIHRLSGRIPLIGETPRQACVECSVRGTPTSEKIIREKFMAISAELGVDIAFQEDDVFRRNRRLVCFDMDSTLIQTEVIDELAKRAGVGAEVSAITERAMHGELDFKESLKKRLSFLKGLDQAVLQDIADKLPLTEGAERLISNLKRVGYQTAIISGGFTYFGERLAQQLGIDYVFANKLEIENGKLTGRVKGAIVDGEKKAELLRAVATSEGISLKQVIAVGDGANDLPMLHLAGLGVAFHAKPKVKQDAGHSISTMGLDSILYLIGVRDHEALC